MEIVWLLVPMSVVLALMIIAVFAWALNAGQFDDLEREGLRIFDAGETDATKPVAAMAKTRAHAGALDADQPPRGG
ncbi:MAG: cbb3-type cytochrome oxidase assembly protein CcoS [Aquabacterium sp.]|nr:MAG: cbb3-type cytochrome oxidase assembly protein CcoS [Aquabacterium sp.]